MGKVAYGITGLGPNTMGAGSVPLACQGACQGRTAGAPGVPACAPLTCHGSAGMRALGCLQRSLGMPGVPACTPWGACIRALDMSGVPAARPGVPACAPLTCHGCPQCALGMLRVRACVPWGVYMRALDMPGVPTARPWHARGAGMHALGCLHVRPRHDCRTPCRACMCALPSPAAHPVEPGWGIL
ncbi:hypothetical protein ACLB2K_038673 [Fragaria x ananassa]